MKAGYFTIPDDPAAPPEVICTRCQDCGEYFFPQRRCARSACRARTAEARCRRAARSTATPSCTCRSSARCNIEHMEGYGVGQVDLPEGPRVQVPLAGKQEEFRVGHAARRRARRAARGRRQGHRHRALPAGGELSTMENVAILGVGMNRFGLLPRRPITATWRATPAWPRSTTPGCRFTDIDAAYVGHIFAPAMTGVRVMKEFGLTGIPVQRIENASATGSAALSRGLPRRRGRALRRRPWCSASTR